MNVSANEEKKSQLFSSTHICICLFHYLLLILESDKEKEKDKENLELSDNFQSRTC